MFFEREQRVQISVPQRLLESVFDECDRYDDVETGGRIIGEFREKHQLDLRLTGIIDPGPGARRARTSFFQDGEYQESVFRQIERQHPEIEHLGTWHTHHVNGLDTLSSGDIATYRRTVNHPKHNLSFWYALLVTRKVHDPRRYLVKHFVFFRNDDRIHEVAQRRVRITQDPTVWLPGEAQPDTANGEQHLSAPVILNRGTDDNVLRRLFPGVSPFYSKSARKLCWKGRIELLDDSKADVLIVENTDSKDIYYEASVLDKERPRFGVFPSLRDETPWLAARALERTLNRTVVKIAKATMSE